MNVKSQDAEVVKKMNIVIFDGYTINPGDLSWDKLDALCDKLTVFDSTSEDKALSRLTGNEILMTSKCPITRELMENSPQLKYIGCTATGYNNIDVEAAADLGIAVTNIPAYSTDAVAQHTIALMLELSNHVGLHNASVQDGQWSDNEYFCYWKKSVTLLTGKSLGIIGYGAIGKRVAQIARLALVLRLLQERLRARTGDHSQILLHLLLGHTDTGILNGDRSVLLVRIDADLQRKILVVHSDSRHLLVTQLLQRIRSVRNQLTQEHLLVGVDGVGHNVQQLLRLRLELVLLLQSSLLLLGRHERRLLLFLLLLLLSVILLIEQHLRSHLLGLLRAQSFLLLARIARGRKEHRSDVAGRRKRVAVEARSQSASSHTRVGTEALYQCIHSTTSERHGNTNFSVAIPWEMDELQKQTVFVETWNRTSCFPFSRNAGSQRVWK